MTGFRSTKEVEIFQQELGGGAEVALIYLNASAPIRLCRAIDRGRDDVTPEKFAKRDAQEIRMGLPDIAGLPNVVLQANEGSQQELFGAISTRYRKALKVYTSDRERRAQRLKPLRFQLEGLILRTLLAEQSTEKWLTTTEIAAALNRRFNEAKSKNNVSRYFNQEFHSYYELRFRERDGKQIGVLEYQLSATGLSRAMQLHAELVVSRPRRRGTERAEHAQLSLMLPP
ncbi:MAG: hypothetical protein IPG42_09300 [Betaproteobacteria bacterium]|nr:hypothetical protein [Betaproteobacteria bacterium]